jgi:hypothetical protein
VVRALRPVVSIVFRVKTTDRLRGERTLEEAFDIMSWHRESADLRSRQGAGQRLEGATISQRPVEHSLFCVVETPVSRLVGYLGSDGSAEATS